MNFFIPAARDGWLPETVLADCPHFRLSRARPELAEGPVLSNEPAPAEAGEGPVEGPKTGIGPNIGLRLYPELDAALDAWIAKQPDPKPSRPEAIRRILREALLG